LYTREEERAINEENRNIQKEDDVFAYLDFRFALNGVVRLEPLELG